MKEATPLVSFVLAYYNLPIPLLCQCIDSILAVALTPQEREIIVVDDGSDTSPMNGLMRYADDILYVRQKNQGLSVARNKGIEMARGRYIQFVDSDDHLLTGPYNHCLDLLRHHNSIDMVMFDFTTEAATTQTDFTDQLLTSGTEYMLHHNIRGTACGYIASRTTLSKLRFTPGIWHEDEEFTPLLLIRTEQLCVTDAKAYHYNKHPHSITTQTDSESQQKRQNDRLSVICRLRNQCDYVQHNDRLALQRRVAQLTMDYLYHVILEKRSMEALNQNIGQLRALGLFPLPHRNYTQKYAWFRFMTSSALGRQLLVRTLPLMKRER